MLLLLLFLLPPLLLTRPLLPRLLAELLHGDQVKIFSLDLLHETPLYRFG
ncbi:hypothetical protein M8494_14475 [Serratia ureilytica]